MTFQYWFFNSSASLGAEIEYISTGFWSPLKYATPGSPSVTTWFCGSITWTVPLEIPGGELIVSTTLAVYSLMKNNNSDPGVTGWPSVGMVSWSKATILLLV